ncbi:MAG TPA: NAD(P)/FAD-dependent oxidoreductase, partial [Gemmatimonadales bacterium]|nr:NAD(P)/FAD-dependent oxidoreductase [Gemmatimonadales bacterium]
MTDFVVAGAGLGGSLMAALLGRAGHRVLLLERRADPRSGAVEAGRSINLAISERGLHALSCLDLREAILRIATPLHGRMIHPIEGPLAFQPYGRKGQAINSISRAALNQVLLDAAERSGNVRVRFGRRCTELDLDAGAIMSVDAATGLQPERHAGVILGADGAYSAVRGQLQRRERYDFSQDYLGHGYKELHIPPGPAGTPRLEPNALHIWPRGGYMMMAMANVDGSFTVTLYLAFEGPDSFGELVTPEAVERFFQREFPDAVSLLPGLAQAFLGNPTGTLVTIRSRPWHVAGAVTLLGDACHAIVPFFGQGANAAFEDCLALDAALARHPADLARAFGEYEADRRPNAEAIADLALANFREMRDRVASPLFRFEKRVQALLHRMFPRWFIPLYTMISFTRIPYARARDRARLQSRVVRGVLSLV